MLLLFGNNVSNLKMELIKMKKMLNDIVSSNSEAIEHLDIEIKRLGHENEAAEVDANKLQRLKKPKSGNTLTGVTAVTVYLSVYLFTLSPITMMIEPVLISTWFRTGQSFCV